MYGQWGRVCDYFWDFDDVLVVCCQFGYFGVEYFICCGMYFGKGIGFFFMVCVDCLGIEVLIFYCSYVGKDDVRCFRCFSVGVVCKLNKLNGEYQLFN